MFSRGLGIVTALVNTACSCHSCNYRSWEGNCINHIILLNDRWVRQLVASEWCDISVLGWWLINGALPWWNTTIMMRSKMGWIAKHIRSDCHRVKVVLLCVELLVYWKAIEGTAMLISRENPWILSVQSLEAHHCHSQGWCQQPFWGYLGSTYSTPDPVQPRQPLGQPSHSLQHLLPCRDRLPQPQNSFPRQQPLSQYQLLGPAHMRPGAPTWAYIRNWGAHRQTLHSLSICLATCQWATPCTPLHLT